MTNKTGIDVVRAQLEDDLKRWIAEVGDEPRGTLFYGILTKAAQRFEELVRLRVDLLRAQYPAAVNQIIEMIGEGKPWAKFTLGQSIDVLVNLDDRQSQQTKKVIVGDQARKRFTRIIRQRNALVHRRTPLDEMQRTAPSFLRDLLQATQERVFKP